MTDRSGAADDAAKPTPDHESPTELDERSAAEAGSQQETELDEPPSSDGASTTEVYEHDPSVGQPTGEDQEPAPRRADGAGGGLAELRRVVSGVASADAAPGVLGSYELVRELGRGGLGTVYLGRHTLTGGEAAVKVLSPRYATDSQMAKRFERSVRLAARLSHANLVTILDGGLTDDRPFVVMRYVDGVNLDEVIERRGALSRREARKVVREVARALGYLHDKGVVHRDVKPSNVFLSRDGSEVLLGDFDLLRTVEDEAESAKLTRTGAALGTAAYMAPEQIRGAEVDARSDLYALGAVWYELLAGEPPYGRGSMIELAARVLQDRPRALELAAPGADPTDVAVVERLIARDPDRRPPDAKTLLAEIGRPRRSQRLHPPGEDSTRVKIVARPRKGAPVHGRRWLGIVTAVAVAAVSMVVAIVVDRALRSEREPVPRIVTAATPSPQAGATSDATDLEAEPSSGEVDAGDPAPALNVREPVSTPEAGGEGEAEAPESPAIVAGDLVIEPTPAEPETEPAADPKVDSPPPPDPDEDLARGTPFDAAVNSYAAEELEPALAALAEARRTHPDVDAAVLPPHGRRFDVFLRLLLAAERLNAGELDDARRLEDDAFRRTENVGALVGRCGTLEAAIVAVGDLRDSLFAPSPLARDGTKVPTFAEVAHRALVGRSSDLLPASFEAFQSVARARDLRTGEMIRLARDAGDLDAWAAAVTEVREELAVRREAPIFGEEIARARVVDLLAALVETEARWADEKLVSFDFGEPTQIGSWTECAQHYTVERRWLRGPPLGAADAFLEAPILAWDACFAVAAGGETVTPRARVDASLRFEVGDDPALVVLSPGGLGSQRGFSSRRTTGSSTPGIDWSMGAYSRFGLERGGVATTGIGEELHLVLSRRAVALVRGDLDAALLTGIAAGKSLRDPRLLLGKAIRLKTRREPAEVALTVVLAQGEVGGVTVATRLVVDGKAIDLPRCQQAGPGYIAPRLRLGGSVSAKGIAVGAP